MLEGMHTEKFDWGAMAWLASGAGMGASLAKMTVFAGKTSPLHRHRDCDEIVHVLTGDIEQRVGDKEFAMRAGNTAIIPCGVGHRTHNNGTRDAIMMVCYSSGIRDYENLEA